MHEQMTIARVNVVKTLQKLNESTMIDAMIGYAKKGLCGWNLLYY